MRERALKAAHELALGEIRIRVRRNPGAGVPPTLWDVTDGERIAETFASVPSQSDAADAIRRFRAGDTAAKRLAAATEKAASIEAEAVWRRSMKSRADHRRKRTRSMDDE